MELDLNWKWLELSQAQNKSVASERDKVANQESKRMRVTQNCPFDLLAFMGHPISYQDFSLDSSWSREASQRSPSSFA
jgi:hypothetical protein